MPIPGLYQTGGSTHPGGSITGAPGRNAAIVLLTDLGHDPAAVMSAPAGIGTAAGAAPCLTPRSTSAIANWGPRFTAQGVDPNDFARVTGGIERWEDWLGAWCANGDAARRARPRGRRRGAGLRQPARRGSQPRSATTSASSSGCSTWTGTTPPPAGGRRDGQHGLRLLDPTAERIEIPFGGAAMAGEPAPPAGVNRPPLVLLIAGPGLHQGGVLQRREHLPGPRHGDFLAGRAGAGRDRAARCRSGPTSRPRWRPCSMCCARAPTSTATGSACSGSAWAATTAPGRRPSSHGSGRPSSAGGCLRLRGPDPRAGRRTASPPSPTAAAPPPGRRRTRSPNG